MIEYLKILIIDNMQFVFTEGSYIELFSENDKNYIYYNNQKYKIPDEYNLPLK